MVEGLLIGAVVAIIFCAKPLNVFVKELAEQSPGAFAYICLCLAFLAASWVLGWLGFTCVFVTFVLFQFADGVTERCKKLWNWIRQIRVTRQEPETNDSDTA